MARKQSKRKHEVPMVAQQARLLQATFLITGDKPLLQHNCAGALTRDAGARTKSVPTAADEAERGTYRLKPGGQLYIKPEAFQGSIVGTRGGASGRKIGKMAANSCVLAGVDFLVEDTCPLLHPGTKKPITKYEIDERPVVIQKARVLRARPRIDSWGCHLTVEVNEQYIDLPKLLTLLNISGKMAGVGDFRPQTKGRFGKYHAELLPHSLTVLEVFGEAVTAEGTGEDEE